MTMDSERKEQKSLTTGPDALTGASAVEKQSFWDFFYREFGGNPDPPAYDNSKVDSIISEFEESVKLLGLQMPRTLHGLADFLRKAKRSHDLVEALKTRGRERDSAEVTDLTKSSSKEKKRFWKTIQEAMEGLIPAEPYSASKADRWIKIVSRMASNFGPIDNIEELIEFTAIVIGAGAPDMLRMMQTDPQIIETFDKIGFIDNLWLMPEDSTVLETAADRLDPLFRGLLDRKEQLIADILNGLNSLEPGQEETIETDAALKDLVESAIRELSKTSMSSLEDAIRTRLDQMQNQLGRIAAAQDRLEPIFDQLAEFNRTQERLLQDKLAQEKQAQNKLAELTNVPALPKMHETPAGGKGYTVERERITGTVDPVLFNLFHDERYERGVTVSRLLDIILWQRYGEPQLSQEVLDERPQLPQEERERVLKPKRKPGRRERKT
jgi:hypothetical protein